MVWSRKHLAQRHTPSTPFLFPALPINFVHLSKVPFVGLDLYSNISLGDLPNAAVAINFETAWEVLPLSRCLPLLPQHALNRLFHRNWSKQTEKSMGKQCNNFGLGPRKVTCLNPPSHRQSSEHRSCDPFRNSLGGLARESLSLPPPTTCRESLVPTQLEQRKRKVYEQKQYSHSGVGPRKVTCLDPPSHRQSS